MSRPADFADADFEATTGGPVKAPKLGALEWARWAWRQLTSMRTALLLLLALAVAAVPGSLIPQEGADPNGVIAWKAANRAWVDVANALSLFSVYTSAWFSAIYLLLFLSLIGCVIPRVTHHLGALRTPPPRTPARLERLASHRIERAGGTLDEALRSAERLLKRRGYRVTRFGASVSAERGYLRETGNLVFHVALLGILVAVFIGGGLTWTGSQIVSVGDTFLNAQSQYDSIVGGRFTNLGSIPAYSLRLDSFQVSYTAASEPIDYTAHVTVIRQGQPDERRTIKVNEPLDVDGTSVFLLGNGYSPHIIIRNAQGRVTSDTWTPFRPQTQTNASLGVVKNYQARPDAHGVALLGFFYPTAAKQADGAFFSEYAGLVSPLLSLNVYEGNLHGSTAQNVYTLNTDGLTEVAGASVGGAHPPEKAVQLKLGQKATLPNGLGSVEFAGVKRFVSLDVHHDPTQGWVATFVVLAVAGLITSLLVPRRRMWVKVRSDDEGGLRLEYAALARGDDPGLQRAVDDLAEAHRGGLGPVPERDPLLTV